jgi:CRP/FNR family cyclic AMP-dependent transcriptional regulator
MRLHRDAKAELIRSIPLFAECTEHELARVSSIADEIDLGAGRQLAKESSPGQEFVVIVEGTAEVRQGDDVINTMGPGQFFGEIAIVTGQPRTASVIASSPVHALVIESHAFQRLLAEAPDIRTKVERAAWERLDHDHDADATEV